MRSRVSHRILVLALVLARLAFGDFVQLPAAHAAGPEHAPSKMMMAADPCPGMGDLPADHAGQSVPGNDGTCCKSPQCPCLHAPALMIALQMPVVFGSSYAEISAFPVHVLREPPAVFFRPPI